VHIEHALGMPVNWLFVHDLDRRFGFEPKHTILLVSTCTTCLQ
jgi:hypothetical protein